MKFERRFTSTDRPVVAQIEWKTVQAEIDRKTARLAEVEVPAGWSQNAANIFADMYLRKAGVPISAGGKYITHAVPEAGVPNWLLRSVPSEEATFGAETSARQVFRRLAGAWTYHGWKEGYFAEIEKFNGVRINTLAHEQNAEHYARAFYDEVYWCLAMQLAAPNSPQWFNTGLWWAYGIEGADTGMWRVPSNPRSQFPPKAERVPNSYEYPQPHACFLTSTADELVGPGGIMDTWVREARIFKHGSGSGINPSVWRGRDERLSGGGVASGVMSWLSIGDRAAGAIQSGGTTRRAAKLVCLDDDHPELIEFIRWKVREEGKAAAMDVGSRLLRNYYNDAPGSKREYDMVPQPMVDRLENGFEPEVLPATWESEAMRTIDGQNSNNSVRPTDRFMRATEEGGLWNLTARTTGEVVRTLPAAEVWDEICRAAWACADPGLLFHDTINAWNTCAADGVIRTSNPCCEFHHLDGSACNLASLRLTAFLRGDGTIDLDAYEHVARLFTVVLDISVSMASFPAEEFALGAWNYRTLGLGYADLGGLLMRLALPYDSDEGRALAAALTALMTAVAYRTSAEMAAELGPFPRWEANQIPFRVVMQKHREAVRNIGTSTDQVGEIVIRAQERWNHVQMSAPSFRNAQTTLIAPTGTISFVLDCDTSGCEPDYALVKTKQLAGGRGAAMRIVNQAVPAALRQLGYDDSDIIDAEEWIKTRHELSGWPRLHPKYEHKHLKVFQCVAELRPMAHVEMLAAIQPFLSGAASKTVNLPNGATVEDVSTIYREAWRRGVKAIALYRDGSKLTQPLAAAKREIVDTSDTPEVGEEWFKKARRVEPKNPVVIEELRRGERESLPPRRRGETQKARVGGQTVYWRTGEYPDGRLGEVFIDLAGAGSTLDGFANSLAKIASIALQFGAPPEKVVDALLGVRFEPSGHVELHDRVKWCASIVDLVARDLGIAYCGREDLANVVAAVAVDSQREVVALDRRAIAVAAGVPTGERCGHCGGPLVQTGTCRTCGDCGRSEGGCG